MAFVSYTCLVMISIGLTLEHCFGRCPLGGGCSAGVAPVSGSSTGSGSHGINRDISEPRAKPLRSCLGSGPW